MRYRSILLSEGALFRLFAAPERVSDIALQPGETLTSVAAGDTVRWTVGDTTSGSGETKRTHLLVKPFAAGLSTNLVITTDRRVYHVQLTSTASTAMTASALDLSAGRAGGTGAATGGGRGGPARLRRRRHRRS